jgi:predicted signal transduction protein with EAL and GGDEF domain
MERLQRAIGRTDRHPEHRFAVLFVDLDRFKTVNDSLGHQAGDRLLLTTAERLTSALRRDDIVARQAKISQSDADRTLARLGGDEFTILVEDIRDPSDAVRIAERIHHALSQPVSLEGQEVFTSASVGIVIGTPAHQSGESVLRDADIAMYRAKASGGNQFVLFDDTMHRRAVERLRIETDLRRAIERHELELHYQPIVSLSDRRLVGVEALVRWNHPSRGKLPPETFMDVAEETGLVTRIDNWALNQACDQARNWQGARNSAVSVSVNISAQGFAQPDIVPSVANALRRTGLDPSRLRLELTESVAMADAERARIVLLELKALGIRLSLDDFGIGYSSLSYLQRFPVDALKIDRSFVAGIDQNSECREIVRSILNLARSLRISVIAEGTETAAQVEYLDSLRCEFGQGYYFSPPLMHEELTGTFELLPDRQGTVAG